jgi:hypothetical protein
MLDGSHGAEARPTLSRRLRDGVFLLSCFAGALGKLLAAHFCALLMQRECLLFHEHLPHWQEIRIIDREHVSCDAADGDSSDEFCSYPREMVAPSVLPWVEQPDEFAGGCIVSGDVRTLMPGCSAGKPRQDCRW